MVVENSNRQSTTGKLASGYTKITGYTNIFGIIILFIVGSLMILGGLILALLFANFFPLVFSVIGIIMIFFGIKGWKWSKRMREGKYYHLGKGWVKPQ